MDFPVLRVDTQKLKHNYQTLKALCDSFKIELVPVTKVALSEPSIVKPLVLAGATTISDSRLLNLKRIKDNFQVKTMLLRMLTPRKAQDVVELADISLNSELSTIKKIGEYALKKGVVHQIIVMVEMGDLREGVPQEELIPFLSESIRVKGVEILGLGCNLTCYGGVIPSLPKMEKLYSLKRKAEKELGVNLPVVSGGSSNLIHLLMRGKKLPINQMRVGEGIFLGVEAIYKEKIPGLYQDVFTLEAEVIEVKVKPSIPRGRRTINAFDEITHFKDYGNRRRALVALGRQDIMLGGLTPVESGIRVLGASSDHLVLDVEESFKRVEVGDIISFRVNYGALLQAMTSPFVNKTYL